jgi:hypothetical protein
MPKVQAHAATSSGRGRRGRNAFVATSLAEINVVPLVDVMLVLLIIFMVTAPMLQQGLEVNLPQASRAKPVNAQPVYVTIPADFIPSPPKIPFSRSSHRWPAGFCWTKYSLFAGGRRYPFWYYKEHRI